MFVDIAKISYVYPKWKSGSRNLRVSVSCRSVDNAKVRANRTESSCPSLLAAQLKLRALCAFREFIAVKFVRALPHLTNCHPFSFYANTHSNARSFSLTHLVHTIPFHSTPARAKCQQIVVNSLKNKYWWKPVISHSIPNYSVPYN